MKRYPSNVLPWTLGVVAAFFATVASLAIAVLLPASYQPGASAPDALVTQPSGRVVVRSPDGVKLSAMPGRAAVRCDEGLPGQAT